MHVRDEDIRRVIAEVLFALGVCLSSVAMITLRLAVLRVPEVIVGITAARERLGVSDMSSVDY